ncbi:uncharacterized protein LOC112053773 [Bicyclus anynana]|uniref:Microsomal glutathione S-transferase 1 n=1 Tax=Bicyclus anynana TaxID=110368 RepID=A0ABM3M7Y4_BICAN|nr:uncharacterized protein LOC112053773 [Bicyclus anynana]
MAAIQLSDPLVQTYIFYSTILALKLLAMGTLTSLIRMGRGSFANPEDAKAFRGKVKLDDPIVERTRRAHLNDLENIPAFWILGALYLTTAPVAGWATLLFRVYTVCRVIHSLVYAVVPLPQPARGAAYMVPYVIKWYMGVQTVLYYLSALSDPLVQTYIFYSTILALKLLAMGTLTSLIRMGRGSFANPEDAKAFRGKVKLDDPIVERTRRAHLNDLENIPAFWILGALYLTTAPVAGWATLLFRVYTVCRVIHSLVYAVVPLPQPARGAAYMVPYVIKWYMGVQTVLYYLSAA